MSLSLSIFLKLLWLPQQPVQDIAAGGFWDGRASVLLSSLVCTELRVMLSTSAPPLGLAASAPGICPHSWSEISSLPYLWHFQFTVTTFAVAGTPRPFATKYFVSQVLVFCKWPPAFSCCLCTQAFLGTP